MFDTEKLIRAIQETIDNHQESMISGRGYNTIADICPLCASFSCLECPWHLLEHEFCTKQTTYDYTDNEESIKRLNTWIQRINARELG